MENQFTRAVAAYNAGEIDLAISRFKAWVEANPNSVEGWTNLAIVLGDKRQHSLAEDAYQKAIQNEIPYRPAYINLGALYLEQLRFAEAIEICQKGLEYFPQTTQLLSNIAYAYSHTERVDEAIEFYFHAIKGDAVFAEPHIELARLLADKERWHESLEQYQTILEFTPNWYAAHFGIGWAYAHLHQYREAIEAYKQFLSFSPFEYKTLVNVSSCYLLVYAEERDPQFVAKSLPFILRAWLIRPWSFTPFCLLYQLLTLPLVKR